MTVSVIPALVDALVSNLRLALPDRIVADGFHTSEDVGHFLEVGVEDPDLLGFTTSAESVQDWAHAGSRVRDEEGDVACAALSWDAFADPKVARDGAFRTVNAVADLIGSDPTIGNVPGVLWTTFGSRFEYHHGQTNDGAVAQVLFRIHFRARIQ